jgi:uroporphyrinogen III methyltransferase/synthase
MDNLSTVFKAGTRGSKLALLQTRQALDKCQQRLPGVRFDMVPLTTPGDLDRSTDLRDSPADFFTRDLDESVLTGQLDCALHSAKDLPDALPAGLDFFWLPWREDPRDAIVLRLQQHKLPPPPHRIGVSSERRAAYCRQHFPDAAVVSIRGNIDERLAQLDRGDVDLLIMAAAALRRLGLEARIHEYIPLHEMQVPAGQGAIAMTFGKGDPRFIAVRNLLVHPVVLAGAGVGSADNATRATITALRNCDVCFHDSLIPPGLLEELPAATRKVLVGKRAGHHSVTQAETSRQLVASAKQGWRVVRLKGGDPTVFGRLAEEAEALQAEQLPFRVLPGVGTFSVAAARTGILPTRRDAARCFTVMTPRKAGCADVAPLLPAERLHSGQILYMAREAVVQVAQQYLAEGMAAETAVAVIYDVGGPREEVVSATLGGIDSVLPPGTDDRPALVFIGESADPRFRFKTHAPLEGQRLLYCGAREGLAKAEAAVARYGGRFVPLPMIALELCPEALAEIGALRDYDWVIITSPSCARLLINACRRQEIDLRRMPALMVAGPGTASVFAENGLFPEVVAEEKFGIAGLVNQLGKIEWHGRNVLRLRSDVAGARLTERLREKGAMVRDVAFYRNRKLRYDALPEFDAAVFTSVSAAKAFADNFGTDVLKGKTVCAIGPPTSEYLRAQDAGMAVAEAVTSTIAGCIEAVAGQATAALIQCLSADLAMPPADAAGKEI